MPNGRQGSEEGQRAESLWYFALAVMMGNQKRKHRGKARRLQRADLRNRSTGIAVSARPWLDRRSHQEQVVCMGRLRVSRVLRVSRLMEGFISSAMTNRALAQR